MTFSFSASCRVQLRGQRGQAALFGSTACAAAFALRPLPPARKRICASESWISLARRSLPTLPPPMSIGVAAPVFEAGTIAARSEAWSTKNPALAARAPLGATNAITGIGRAQLGLRDLAHGREQATGRLELEHHGIVMRLGCGADLVDDPVGRDRVDVRVEHDHAHVRRLRGCARRQCEAGDEGDGQEAQSAHRRPQRTPVRGGGRDAEARREAAVVRARPQPARACALPALPGGGGRADPLRGAPRGDARDASVLGAPRAVRVRPARGALARRAGGRGGGARARQPRVVVALDEPGARRRRRNRSCRAGLGRRQRCLPAARARGGATAARRAGRAGPRPAAACPGAGCRAG